jgi:hypothetical protein
VARLRRLRHVRAGAGSARPAWELSCFATALFGGTAPLFGALLVGLDLVWILPTYVAAMVAMGLVAARRVDETAFSELR